MAAEVHPLGYESKTAYLPTGHYYRYVDVHPPQDMETIATALLIHGFPDSAYGWRHQTKGWSDRGIRLIIPDALGYTGSSQPLDPDEYNFKWQSNDYEALIKYIGLPEGEKIILIGHDWGAITAIRLSQYKPDLVRGVVSIGVPFALAKPAQVFIPTEQLAEIFPSFGYQMFFASLDSSATIDSKTEKFINLLFISAKQFESGGLPYVVHKGVIESWLGDETKSVNSELLTKKDIETMINEIKAGVGFSAMLNYYRTGKINYELEKDLPQNYLPHTPKLLVVPLGDIALPPQFVQNAENDCENLEVVRFEDSCGHWVQLEMPERLEKVVGEWVQRIYAQEGRHNT